MKLSTILYLATFVCFAFLSTALGDCSLASQCAAEHTIPVCAVSSSLKSKLSSANNRSKHASPTQCLLTQTVAPQILACQCSVPNASEIQNGTARCVISACGSSTAFIASQQLCSCMKAKPTTSCSNVVDITATTASLSVTSFELFSTYVSCSCLETSRPNL